MDRNFYTDDFEHFLNQKADQHKMYPSDRVWRGIYHSLHTRRKWYTLGALLLLLTAGLFVSREFLLSDYSDTAKQLNSSLQVSGPVAKDIADDEIVNPNAGVLLRPLNSGQIHTAKTFLSIITETVNPDTDAVNSETEIVIVEDEPLPIEVIAGIAAREPAANSPEETASAASETEAKIIEAEKVTDPKSKPATEKLEAQSAMAFQKALALADVKQRRQKWSLNLYASPIVSYRRLSNLNTLSSAVPVAINFNNNLDNYVQHKPALGFELGTKMQYHLSKSLKLYAGAQVNYSRYTIEAYKTAPERATIALNSVWLSDTISNYTSLRNFGGNSGKQLQNQYLQVSVPMGAELRLLGHKRLQLSVSGSVQPTYLLTSDSYLISTDYKNYIQNPELARRWNVHTNFEAFLTYKMGSVKWQFGPQFRYQLLSSYSDKYPIREYLTEYGIKLGISKTIR